MTDSERATGSAVELFAAFLERGGDPVGDGFGELCREYPNQASELERLRANFGRLEGLFDDGLGGTDSAPPLASVELSSASGEVLDRLSSRSRTADRYRGGGSDGEVDEIGRGGMGAVVRVFDVDLRRELAMKVLLDGSGGSSATPTSAQARRLRRFLDEAQITGQLEHPGVVPVHELGLDDDGQLFFTMRLVRGRDLGEIFGLVRDGREGWNRARALSSLLRACETMAFAHDRGVIHRDLKPANVMVGEFGETYVMDWGLAKVVGDERAEGGEADERIVRTDASDSGSAILTRDGTVLGTPAYMPPEQARGDLDAMSSRSDVYSVGAMLYHLLAGHPPYLEEGGSVSAADILGRLSAGPPASLDALGEGDVPAELVAVCERAMERDPQRRYADMGEMAADLSSFLEGRVVRAYETGAVAEFRKWVRRNRGMAASLAATILVALGGLASTAFVQARSNEVLATKNDELGELNLELDAARDDAVAEATRANENAQLADANAELARENEAAATLEKDRVLRLADLTRLSGLVARFEALYPVRPHLEPELSTWLAEARELGERLDVHRATLDVLRTNALPAEEIDVRELADRPYREQLEFSYAWLDAHARILEENSWTGKFGRAYIEQSAVEIEATIERLEKALDGWRPWRFRAVEAQWEHDQLERLIRGIEELFAAGSYVERMERRLEIAASLAERSVTGDEAARRWAEAIGSIAESSLYDGLVIQPQVGLLPVGRDPNSTLWEFVDLATGTDVGRRPDGALDVTADTGVVFVLLPAAEYVMGAVLPSEETGEHGMPYVDRAAFEYEAPLHPVPLDAFFMGKHELTQAQWERFTGENPSLFFPGADWFDEITPLHPVENVSWNDAKETLERMGFELPTEAQWEYAARGTTTTPWWTGPEKESLAGAVNLADMRFVGVRANPNEATETWLDDGYAGHAPVTSYRPNPFGLHCMLGNVTEWCADVIGQYDAPIWPGTGYRFESLSPFRVQRGGSFSEPAIHVRSTTRLQATPLDATEAVGVRAVRRIE